jgi:YVTN family beta-propeller protein
MPMLIIPFAAMMQRVIFNDCNRFKDSSLVTLRKSLVKTKSTSTLLLAILLPFSVLQSSPSLAEESTYELRQRFTLGDAEKYDFTAVDNKRLRLYVTRGDRIDVVNLATNKVMGTIPETYGVGGVTFAQDLNLGFTSNRQTNTVTVFNLESMRRVTDIQVAGSGLDSILYEPAVHKVYVFNRNSSTVDVIDAKTLKIIHSIKSSGKPSRAVTDNYGHIYLNVQEGAGVDVIDATSDKLVSTWSLAGCDQPSGLAIDVDHSRLISACRNRIAVVTNALTGTHIAQFAIGDNADSVLYDSESRNIFVANGGEGGTLTVTHQSDSDQYRVIQNLATLNGAKSMTMNKQSKEIFLPVNADHKFVVLVVNTKKN